MSVIKRILSCMLVMLVVYILMYATSRFFSLIYFRSYTHDHERLYLIWINSDYIIFNNSACIFLPIIHLEIAIRGGRVTSGGHQ